MPATLLQVSRALLFLGFSVGKKCAKNQHQASQQSIGSAPDNVGLSFMKKSSTIRSTYKDGRISGEIRVSRGKLDGLSRYWHENGVLALEIPLKAGFRHGLCKQWNERGELLGSFQMSLGTGVVRQWYPNGQLQYEMDTLRGVPNGRQRLWSEQGELVAESFYLDGKSVSFVQYRRACKRNPDLPVYAAESLPQAKGARPVGLPKRKAIRF